MALKWGLCFFCRYMGHNRKENRCAGCIKTSLFARPKNYLNRNEPVRNNKRKNP